MRLRKRDKLIIIIFIIVAALVIPLYNVNNLIKQSSKKIEVNNEKALKLFENYDYQVKEQRYYKVENYREVIEKLQKLSEKDWFAVLHSNIDMGRDYSLFIGEFPIEKVNEYYEFVNSIDGLTKQNKERKNTKTEFVYEKHIENKATVIKAIKEKIEKSTLSNRQISDYNKQLSALQTQIDSLNTAKKIHEKSDNNQIVYIQIEHGKQNGISILQIIKTFVIQFVIMLILALIGLVIFSLVYKLISFVMEMLGIKTKMGTSRYGNYSNYSRNVKRKYKSSKSKDSEE